MCKGNSEPNDNNDQSIEGDVHSRKDLILGMHSKYAIRSFYYPKQ